ncbi:hypothetical protein PM082_015859 [Marasmius tenuissimus]|nr:hypothetical protein PM082_015859 [Marasmius tenuissimus]
MGLTIPEVEVESFLNEGPIPVVSRDVVDRIWNELQKMGWNVKERCPTAAGDTIDWEDGNIVRVVDRNGRWGWYANEDPGLRKQWEDVAYIHIEDISDCILKAAETVLPGKKPTARFRCSPPIDHSTTKIHNSGTTSGMALVGSLQTTAKAIEHEDNVVNARFNKYENSSDVNENSREIVQNAAHMLYSDARRRFRFGLSVDNCQTRFWYFSRAVWYVTARFDFIQAPQPLIQFILALSFASEEEMGYDPTVRRLEFEGAWVYDYQVVDADGKEAWFRTKQRLYDYRWTQILGQGLRVWEAHVLDASGFPIEDVVDGNRVRRTVVLKDYWLPLEAPLESDTQGRIIAGALSARGLEATQDEELRKYFMTILHDVVVQVEEGKRLAGRDYISSEALDGNLWIDTYAYITPEVDVCVYKLRKHCRTVFKEVGLRLDDISDQQVFVDCLVDSLEALKILYDAKWVHRDISVGNLLRCYHKPDGALEGTYVCKITDLECAQPFLVEQGQDANRRDDKIGTPAFMATEIHHGDYRFRNCDGISSFEILETSHQDLVQLPFHYNYIHDMEGIFWIFMWNLFSSVPTDVAKTLTEAEYWKVRQTAEALFPSHYRARDRAERMFAFSFPQDFKKHYRGLCREYRPLGVTLRKLWVMLREFYTLAENPLEKVLEHDTYSGMHERLKRLFSSAQESAFVHITYLNDVKKLQQGLRQDEGSSRDVVDDGGRGMKRSLASGDQTPAKRLKPLDSIPGP